MWTSYLFCHQFHRQTTHLGKSKASWESLKGDPPSFQFQHQRTTCVIQEEQKKKVKNKKFLLLKKPRFKSKVCVDSGGVPTALLQPLVWRCRWTEVLP